MSASKEKKEKIGAETELRPDSPLQQWMKHIGAYLILLIVAMLYFKPVAFDGKSLQQHDNVQALAMQTEIRQYKKSTGKQIKWTNNFFGGMPTTIIASHSPNYINSKVVRPLLFFQGYNEWVNLFMILISCYIGLRLLGLGFVLSVALSVILGFFTSNTLFIAAGHTGKMNVLALTPVMIGALVYAYKKNALLGSMIFAFGFSYSLSRNHVQITYYTFFALGIIGLFLMYEAIKEKKLANFYKFAGAMVFAVLLGVISNLGALWPNYEYGQESTRGTTELTKVDHKSGLAKDYIFGLSLEKSEIGMLMFPNFYGGTQGKLFVSNEGSETQAAFRSPRVQQEIVAAAKRANAQDVNQFMNQVAMQYTRQYRGSQTMCGGPIYYGVVVCFLFILALLLLQGALKWGIISTLAFFIILAWGQHFPLVSDLMYSYFPLYNKFRDTKMTMLVAQPLVILGIGAGLVRLFHFKAEDYTNTWSAKLLPKLKQTVSKQGYVVLAGAIAIGICILTYLYLSVTPLSAPKDAELAVISPSLVAALELDRAALAKADISKALIFIIIAMGLLLLYTKSILKKEIVIVLLAVVACVDLLLVNNEYVNKDSYTDLDYIEKADKAAPTKADRDIMKDQSIYHVVDYSRGYPSQNAQACYFHKSMGGYFAAKPLLYQEFWGHYQLDNGNVALKQHSNLMNMLNVKYIILSQERFMDNPTALGNAWFVQNIDVVKNADEELAALDNLDPVLNAVVQEKYAPYVEGLNTDYVAGDKIFLKKYHPDTMIYQSETSKDRFAIFSEMYYPPSKGWNVYIDGKKVDPFVKVNYVLRGLKVPAGKHEIKMVFEPVSISIGATVGSLVSILIIGLLGGATFFAYKKTKEEHLS
ncbi:YfhO family protein [Aureispira anguillae]|uniref:YfhO family protein n=1 Tax=Aureispira anguillae TaxID=2864201 RepID=A0A916DVK7_9BACT|nr:YfhO family protein [Aureispira anguillae]BDS13675.1 YfhO family protein [Aureispira anguillae]